MTVLWRKRLKPDDPEKREKLQEELRQEGGLEKHDVLAMILAALLVLVPAALIVLLLMVLLGGWPILFG